MNTSENLPSWVRLFRTACGLIRQVNSQAVVIDHWTFGGGTAMMLQIDHRESRDVDLFLRDPQLFAFLDPQKHDFAFDIRPNDYGGDGARFMKFAFEGIGEIDFIVAQPKTPSPTIEREIEGQRTLLETVPEVIAKKIAYRGSSLKPRDIFDIAAAGEQLEGSVVAALRPYQTEVAAALDALARLNPQFVNDAISQLQIRDKFRTVARSAMERAKQILRSL